MRAELRKCQKVHHKASMLCECALGFADAVQTVYVVDVRLPDCDGCVILVLLMRTNDAETKSSRCSSRAIVGCISAVNIVTPGTS